MITIGVKYCGNCNPVIDSKKILEETIKCLPEYQFVVPDKNITALLVLSGCESDCATRPDLQVKTIVVAGLSVDCIPCKEEDIPVIVREKLLKLKKG